MGAALVFLFVMSAFAPNSAAWAEKPPLKVTPTGWIGTLTQNQAFQIFNVLLADHTPQEAARIVNLAVVVDDCPGRGFCPGGGIPIPEKLQLTIEERAPGTVEPCLIVVVVGDFDASDDINTLRGDGMFNSPPNLYYLAPEGFWYVYHGTPSVEEPLKIRVTLELQHPVA